jgi:hypothetical protein
MEQAVKIPHLVTSNGHIMLISADEDVVRESALSKANFN